ncbi:MAG: hypothetical protein NZ949_04710 [Candidatus Kapabacteria bacterium]|nr:hypothetical protein [Candidatus Kapabacteria bacterium]MDW7996080.1 hypothetical protein [Bacteroidota bacterium]
MNLPQRLLRWAHHLPLHSLPFPLSLILSSIGRRILWKALARHTPEASFFPPPSLQRSCWGLRFRSPLFNAAGMFKNAEGYSLAYHQGAGAYLVGTTTSLPRRGLSRYGVRQPFASYPHSQAALNALGLPNPGHRVVAHRIAQFPRYPDFPIGASVAYDPELAPEEALPRLLEGIHLYVAAGVDFLELNESCPNVPHEPGWHALEFRLTWLAERFLARRQRRVPVAVKISVDTPVELMPPLLELLLHLGYDGLTIGNTSTAYETLQTMIVTPERQAYSLFWQRIGGGISGTPLAERRRQLVRIATQWLARRSPQQEFHILAVGGIVTPNELVSALADGASLAQWYTGYIHAFLQHGDAVYRWMYTALEAVP